MQYEYVPAETSAAQNGSLSFTNMGGMDSSANQAKAFQDVCFSILQYKFKWSLADTIRW